MGLQQMERSQVVREGIVGVMEEGIAMETTRIMGEIKDTKGIKETRGTKVTKEIMLIRTTLPQPMITATNHTTTKKHPNPRTITFQRSTTP